MSTKQSQRFKVIGSIPEGDQKGHMYTCFERSVLCTCTGKLYDCTGHQNSRYILLILILHSNRTYSYCIEDWVGEGISGPAGRSLYTVILIKIKMKIKMCGCMALIKSLQSRTIDEDADEEDKIGICGQSVILGLI